MSGATGTWNMDVTDVLRDRMHEPSGLQRMTVVSIAVHVVAFGRLHVRAGRMAGFAIGRDPDDGHDDLARRRRRRAAERRHDDDGRPGGPGARPPEQARPEPVRPPAAVAPEMTLPSLGRGRGRSSPDAKQAPDEARGRTPTRGAQTARRQRDRRNRRPRSGLWPVDRRRPRRRRDLDVGDFCCPDYILTMVERITKNWNQSQNVTGLATVKFTIRRDGVLQDVVLEKSSNFPIADLAAQRAVVRDRPAAAASRAFPNPTLTVHLNFQYQR